MKRRRKKRRLLSTHLSLNHTGVSVISYTWVSCVEAVRTPSSHSLTRTTRPVSVSLSSVDVSESVCVCVRLQRHSSTVAVDVLLECVIFLTMLSKCARWTRTTVDDMRIAKHIQYFIYLFMFRSIRFSYPRLLGFSFLFFFYCGLRRKMDTNAHMFSDRRPRVQRPAR